MPSYNQGDYLDEAIRSILEQEYCDLELIVIDGGSQDNSVTVLEELSAHISYWVSEPDEGQSDALNRGFRRATGNVIGWLNSDDTYQPGALSQVALAFSDPAVMVAMADTFGFIDDNGLLYDTKGNEFTDHQTLIRYWMTNGMTVNQPSVFFRREVIEVLNPVLDVSLDYAMDYDLWLRISVHHRFHIVKAHWANYRFHDSSKSVKGSREFVPEWYAVSQRFWGRRYSVSFWKHWLSYCYHWNLKRPVRIAAGRIGGWYGKG